jgi:hypothetical protein
MTQGRPGHKASLAASHCAKALLHFQGKEIAGISLCVQTGHSLSSVWGWGWNSGLHAC